MACGIDAAFRRDLGEVPIASILVTVGAFMAQAAMAAWRPWRHGGHGGHSNPTIP